MLLFKMATLNKVALIFLAIAKFCGFVGVAIGFMPKYHHIGGQFLIAAFTSIGISIFSAIMQMAQDKKTFSTEDEEKKKIESFVRKKMNLEAEIQLLENKRNDLINLSIRKGRV